ncbi:MAG: thioredoxin [Bacteroidetes bacterium]|nr:thioredoxin [Bacteroidota bacterium]
MLDTSKPIHLNYPNFDQVVGQSFILVDFWAEWCAPCKAQDPILEELAKELNGRALIGKVNVDDNRTLANKYGITSIPTMILFKNGKRVHYFVGTQSKERIMHYIDKNMDKL